MITKFDNFLNENNSQEEINNLKKLISDHYEGAFNLNPNFRKTMEITWDNTNKMYWRWVEPYSPAELCEGKTGLSESHPKGKYPDDPELNKYDYVTLAKVLKTNDPYCWKAHEAGHIEGYRKGKRGNTPIVVPDPIENYPNWADEYYPFLRQMQALKKMGKSKDEIVNMIMVDYEDPTHKKEKKELSKMRIFFEKFYEQEINK